MSDRLNVSIQGCARCGGSHTDLKCSEFVRPVLIDRDQYTHWTPCPSTGDPILITIRPDAR